MFRLWHALGLALTAAVCTLAADAHSSSLHNRHQRRALASPRVDSFYNPFNASYQGLAVGTVLRSRKVDTAFYSFPGVEGQLKVSAAYQLLYVTTDKEGEKTHNVATMLVPERLAPGPLKITAMASAENSPSPDCAISYKIRPGSNRADIDFAIEQVLMERQLDQGYVLLLPDSEGNKAAFAVGRVEFRNFLDAIRAGLSFREVVKDPSTARVGLFGYSGGGQVVGWAVQEAPGYAPELQRNIVGASYGGMPIDMKKAFTHLNKGSATGMAMNALFGTANVFPELDAFLDRCLTNDGRAARDAARFKPGYCLIDAVTAFANRDVFAYFKPGCDVLNDPSTSSVWNQGKLGAGMVSSPGASPSAVPGAALRAPSFPVRIYQAVDDQVVVTEDNDVYVKTACGAGYNIDYWRESDAEHQGLSLTGTPAAIGWLDDRFNGVPLGAAKSRGCTTQTVRSSFGPREFGIAMQMGLARMKDLLSGPSSTVTKLGEKRIPTIPNSVAEAKRLSSPRA